MEQIGISSEILKHALIFLISFQFSQMGAYVRFCSSQYTAAALLQKLVEIKPGFDDFLRQCQSGPKVKGMPLSFFLLKPVKRVMDYPMLVEKILKNTESSHPDYFFVEKALKLSKKLCEQVNEGTRHKENTERLEWLQIHVDSVKNPGKIHKNYQNLIYTPISAFAFVCP